MNHNKLSFILDIGLRINQIVILCLLIASIKNHSNLGIIVNVLTLLFTNIVILITDRRREQVLKRVFVEILAENIVCKDVLFKQKETGDD